MIVGIRSRALLGTVGRTQLLDNVEERKDERAEKRELTFSLEKREKEIKKKEVIGVANPFPYTHMHHFSNHNSLSFLFPTLRPVNRLTMLLKKNNLFQNIYLDFRTLF